MAKILLAADPTSARTRAPLRPCLEAAGHEVREVGDGPAVLAALRVALPDALVLDTALPVLDGFQVLVQLQRDGTVRRVPVVVLSGVAPVLVSRLVDDLGAAAYLPKPIACQALCEALDRVLGLRLAAPAAADQRRAGGERLAPGAAADATPARTAPHSRSGRPAG